MKTQSISTNSIHRSLGRCALLSVLLLLACFALSPQARAICQEGCDISGRNTFLGDDALLNNTGLDNTAIGATALFHNANGQQNTAIGVNALRTGVSSFANTATGDSALENN